MICFTQGRSDARNETAALMRQSPTRSLNEMPEEGFPTTWLRSDGGAHAAGRVDHPLFLLASREYRFCATDMEKTILPSQKIKTYSKS